MSSLIPVNDTEAQWKNHFVDMAHGKIPYSDYYIVSMNQTGKGDSKKPDNPMQDKMFGATHDPSTGRIINPVSAAANQTLKEMKSIQPAYNVVKTASKRSTTSTKTPTKKQPAAEEPKPKKTRKKKPKALTGPDAFDGMASKRKISQTIEVKMSRWLPAYKYDCMWCHTPELNQEGKLYCKQCEETSVGQCQECKMHVPYGYMFNRDQVCIGCDVKSRMKKAKKENDDKAGTLLDIYGKKRKKSTPQKDLTDTVRKLESEKNQLCLDLHDLNKENRTLRSQVTLWQEHSMSIVRESALHKLPEPLQPEIVPTQTSLLKDGLDEGGVPELTSSLLDYAQGDSPTAIGDMSSSELGFYLG
jgi:hypothetical protein